MTSETTTDANAGPSAEPAPESRGATVHVPPPAPGSASGPTDFWYWYDLACRSLVMSASACVVGYCVATNGLLLLAVFGLWLTRKGWAQLFAALKRQRKPNDQDHARP